MYVKKYVLVPFLAVASLCFSIHAETDLSKEGFIRIFNGKDLEGCEGDQRVWSVADGVIKGQTTPANKIKNNSFLIYRKSEVEDFELRLTFKLKSGNGGFQYRSKDLGEFRTSGYQYDFHLAGGSDMAKLFHEKGRGLLCSAGQKVVYGPGQKKNVVGKTCSPEELKKATRKGDWNECVIIAKGNHLIHKLNGVSVVDFTDNDEEGRLSKGILAIQLHRGKPMEVEVKDIWLRKL